MKSDGSKQATTMATGVVNQWLTEKKKQLGQLKPNQEFVTSQVMGDSESVAFIGSVHTRESKSLPEQRSSTPVKLRIIK